MGDMLRLVAKRLGLGLLTLLVVSVLIFFAVELLPGDIAEAVLGQGATEETVAALREQLGLDRPAPVRYFDWLGGAVTGDFGVSLVTGERVSSAIGDAVRQHAVPGLLCRRDRGAVRDHPRRHRRAAAQLDLRPGRQRADADLDLVSPEFFLGYILILFFAVKMAHVPGHRQPAATT